ncbi:MAG: hypothetical protein HY319_19640 [Armatimonadetes bacterium]|nr:hypothetical protein [Armatimonadota bacterium]
MHITSIQRPTSLPSVPRTGGPDPAPAEDRFVPSEWLPRPFPRTAAPAPVAAPAAPEPGSKKEFWVWDMGVMPPGQKAITATCRAVGDAAYVFVDDAVWERLVTEEDVDRVDRVLHRASPSGSVDPTRGVAGLDHAYFGAPPLGQDGDPKVYVLVTEIASFKGTTMDGYFNPFDTLTDEEAQQYGQRSNEAEVVYLNAASRRVSGDYMLGVLSHEYQHLLHHPHDSEEEPWLSEMIAEAAMSVNGFHTDYGHAVRHLAHPERPLVSQTYVDYGACMLFGTYLLERYGKGFYQELASNPTHGVASIDQTLERLGQPERFGDLYRDWLVANYADSRNVTAPGLHYASLDLPAPAETAAELPSRHELDLKPSGARYLRLSPEAQQIRLEGTAEGLTLEVLEFDGKRVRRTTVELSEEGSVSLPGGGDRVLVVGSLAAEDRQLALSFLPA